MRILVGSDSPYIPSGFAKQLKGIATHLSKEHDVWYLAWQTRGDFKINDYPFKIIGCKTQFGKGDWQRAFRKIHPDLVISLGDAHMVDALGRMQRPLWIGYYPLDGHPISQLIGQVIQSMDIPLAMSQFGQNLTEQQLNIKPFYIPHFYDDTVFERLPEYRRNKLREKNNIPKDAFVIGCVARLNPRKHHQRLLMAFSNFVKMNPDDDIYLYLHLDPHDPLMFQDTNHNYQFVELIDTMGITDRVIITNNITYDKGVSEEKMNEIYNLFDVHVIATGGEGFGVPFIEGMACGLPTIATDYTTSAEIIKAQDPYSGEVITDLSKWRGLLVQPSRYYLEQSQVHKAWIDIDELVKMFDFYYNDRDILRKHGDNAEEYVQKYYTYDKIMERWDDLLDRYHNSIYIAGGN